MWNMLTAWTIQLRTALARVHLAMLVGSLPAPASPMAPTATLTVVQHQPWEWTLLYS